MHLSVQEFKILVLVLMSKLGITPSKYLRNHIYSLWSLSTYPLSGSSYSHKL